MTVASKKAMQIARRIKIGVFLVIIFGLIYSGSEQFQSATAGSIAFADQI
jgi:hypothetical protein